MAPADDYGIPPYELDPWDKPGDEDADAFLSHAGWMRKAEDEVCEKGQWRQRDVQALREMVQGENMSSTVYIWRRLFLALRFFLAAAPKLVSPLDDGFLLRFLRAQKFDYEKAFAMVCFPTKYRLEIVP